MSDTQDAWKHSTYDAKCEGCGEITQVARVLGTKPGGTELCWRCTEKLTLPKMIDRDAEWR